MRNQNVRLAQGKKCLGSFALQIANYSLRNILNVECAFAQIWIIDFAQASRRNAWRLPGTPTPHCKDRS